MTAIMSKGALAAIGAGGSDYYFTTPNATALEGYMAGRDYATLYATQSNVRLIVDFLARNIGQVGLQFFRRVSDTDRVRLIGESIAGLMERPNVQTTPYRLMSSLVSDLAIFGVGYWVKLSGGAQIARMQPWRVTVLGTDATGPVGFALTAPDGSRVVLPPSRVVYFRFYNPVYQSLGLSPLESLRTILAEEAAAQDYRARFWLQGAKVSGFIERPKDAPRWSGDARDRFQSDWNARYTGQGLEVGGTPVLEDGMTYKPGSFSARDSQYLEARKLAREEVAAAYHVPPPMVGILDNANYSNTKQFHQQLYQDTLGPWFELIAQEIELQLLPDYEPAGDVYAEFNINAKLQGSFEEQAAALSLAIGGPWMTRAEGRGRANLPDLHDPEAAELITPLNVSIGGQAAPNAPQGGAGSLQAQVIERAVTRLVSSMSHDGAAARVRRVMAEAEADLAALNGGAA